MKNSLHAPLSGLLRRAQAACAVAAHTGAPVDEVWESAAPALPRRALIAGAAALAALPRVGRTQARGTRVVIVGAGLAGLACARRLAAHGVRATIYEGSDRVGGRTETLRGYFARFLQAELHGQFVSSEHQRMIALANFYGFGIENVNSHLGNTADTGWFGGRRYTEVAFVKAWREQVWELFRDAGQAAPGATWQHATPTARAWDHLSVPEWVDRYVPGGVGGPLGGVCLADVLGEYGGPPEDQSALNLIQLLAFNTSRPSGLQSRQFPVVAGTDEKYHVRGGNDQIAAAIATELGSGAVQLEHKLLALRETAARAYRCTFQAAGNTVDVEADHVVLAIPPAPLRDVALAIPLAPVQQRAIAGATLGTNAKILLQVEGRPWIADGFSGSALTSKPVSGCWDTGCFQPGGHGPDAEGLWVAFPGGNAGAALGPKYGLKADEGAAPAAMVADTLAQIEPVFPGMTAAWQAGPQRAYYKTGLLNPLLRGAYSYFRVGQYTSFAGAQSLPAGGVHFAGEHTSLQYQGFMEGAVQSGARVAEEILAA